MENKNQLEILQLDKIIGSHSAPIYCLGDLPNSDSIFTCAGDRFVAKWNIEIGLQDKFAIQLESSAYQVVFIQSLNYLIIGLSNGNLHVIDLVSNEEIKLIKISDASIYTIRLSEDEQFLFITTADSKIGIWHLPSFEHYQTIQLESGKIRACLVIGNELIIGCQTGEIRTINYKELKETHRFQAHETSVYSLLYLKEKNVLVSGGQDANLRFWKLKSDEELLSIPAHNFSIYSLTRSDKFLFSGSRDGSIKVWNINSLEMVQKVDRFSGGHMKSVNGLIYSKSKNQLFSVSDDHKIIAWKVV